ncbi:hypothetical protein PpBr36_08383 [Pyricularia pennisetigena]|uniref:hypothetical protein n=1 Tax=Pyricularia pennisetigena TaxID=1578925 RepID=UPI00114F96BC|nr:hypothetical protein PpBr36_08383 [Pyricularia pennisetigena]TLS24218.1 hypothetical protein PpBr36_08383 [Pyricularia pennisetigena]
MPLKRPRPTDFYSDSESEESWDGDGRDSNDEDDVTEDGTLVIGIDFGTTYSGVAWATVNELEEDINSINIIYSWPGTGREEGKAPSELFYKNGEALCGFEVPSDAKPIKWFKLLLLKDEDVPSALRSSSILAQSRKFLKMHDKTAVDVIADYLRVLWKHTMDTIVRSRSELVVNALQFSVVLTVPAIWKGYARQAMEEAAKKAGILDKRAAGPTTLTFVPEPEAAALATLTETARKVDKGGIYIICDAGGGTVDLITYKIDQVKPIKMSEAIEGKGSLCGGAFIDAEFEKLCKDRLGDRWLCLSPSDVKELLKGEWETGIKPQFRPGAAQEFTVRVPAEAFLGSGSFTDTSREPHIKNGRMFLSSKLVESTFKGSFAGIDKLVNEQIELAMRKHKKVNGIILVGGLGGSPHLYHHLDAIHANSGIVVMQSTGMKPRTAICRGAVIKGFLASESSLPAANSRILVTSTVSRDSLGIVYREEFKQGKHLEEDKAWGKQELTYLAINQMQWFLKKGQSVSSKKPVRHKFYELLNPDTGLKPSIEIELYQCDREKPPPRKEDCVKLSCKMSFTLDVRPADLEPWANSKGKKFKKFSYEIEMIPSGASPQFVFWVNGRKQGSHNAHITYA